MSNKWMGRGRFPEPGWQAILCGIQSEIPQSRKILHKIRNLSTTLTKTTQRKSSEMPNCPVLAFCLFFTCLVCHTFSPAVLCVIIECFFLVKLIFFAELSIYYNYYRVLLICECWHTLWLRVRSFGSYPASLKQKSIFQKSLQIFSIRTSASCTSFWLKSPKTSLHFR